MTSSFPPQAKNLKQMSSTTLRRSRRLSLYHPSLLPLLHCRSLRHLLQIQCHLIVTSLLSDPFASSRLLRVSLSLAHPHYSLLLFCHLPNPDLLSLNSVLPICPNPLHTLLRSPFHPNSFSFTSLVAAAARSNDLTSGEAAHCQALARGFLPSCTSTHVANSLIHFYSACGLVSSACQLFDEMPVRDVVSWNSLVDGYFKVGDLGSALEVFEGMPERNVVSWNVVVSGCLKRRRAAMGLRMVRRAVEDGHWDEKTMVGAATGCGRMGREREGRSVHGRILRWLGNQEAEGNNNVIIGTALVDMYGKCRRVGDARKVFEGLRGRRNLVCWNAMTLSCCVHGDPREGIALFEELIAEQGGEQTRISPDEVTFVGVLSACARGGLLEEGKKYFDQMTSLYHLKPTFAHYWCMASLYGSVGLVLEAEEVLKGMPEEKESLVWSGLLGYCRFRGDIELGERIAKALIELEPFNGSRYTLLWNVYMAAGRWQDAQNVKATMKERGVRAMPNGRLIELNEIVHNFKVGDQSQPEIEEIYTMVDDLAVMLKLPGSVTDSVESS